MPKKTRNSKPSVKVNDLRAKKSPRGGGKKASGKANLSDLSFTHVVDKSSPILMTSTTSTDLKISAAADTLKIK